jgi:iron complex transport system ATP-binding protein
MDDAARAEPRAMTITLDNLSVEIGGTNILNGISGSLKRGRVTALIGPNGAGKTTLLRTILRLQPLNAGTINIDGVNASMLSTNERARRLAYLPQSGAPHWNISARELVGLGRLPWRGTAQDDAVTAALTATDTLQFADRLINTLSGGERARVMLARVLAGESEWIFADEPLANLDPRHQRDVMLRLKATAHDEGKGVVVVVHELSAAADIADDVLILKSGRVIGTTFDSATLEAAFDIPFDLIPHGNGIAVLPRAI